MSKIKKVTKQKELSKEVLEKLSILQKADETKGEQLFIKQSGELYSEKELKKVYLESTDNPEKKYEIYYKNIRNILMKFLPKGNINKKYREIIYEEKNTFLTQGRRKSNKGIRGADSRMTFISDAEILLNLIIKWVSKKETPAELYMKIKELNDNRDLLQKK
jgi:hypothetical protein